MLFDGLLAMLDRYKQSSSVILRDKLMVREKNDFKAKS